MTTTRSVESTSGGTTEFAEDDVATCKWNHERRPEVFAEVDGVAITAGYDHAKKKTVVRRLRAAE